MYIESILRTGTWIALALSLSACIENEKRCYEKLKSDFDSSIAFAKGKNCLDSVGAASCANYAVAASTSNLQILVIHNDDDQSACDFYSDGPHLRRK